MELSITQAIIICTLAATGLITIAALIFTYLILYLNRAERRKDGCDYASRSNNDTNNASNV